MLCKIACRLQESPAIQGTRLVTASYYAEKKKEEMRLRKKMRGAEIRSKTSK